MSSILPLVNYPSTLKQFYLTASYVAIKEPSQYEAMSQHQVRSKMGLNVSYMMKKQGQYSYVYMYCRRFINNRKKLKTICLKISLPSGP